MALACDPACDQGFVCVQGECVEDFCRNVTCQNGQICNPANGQCTSDPCRGVDCAPGMACNPGTGVCVTDVCLGFDCPTGSRCRLGFDGLPQCVDAGGIDVLASGGGGCSVGQGARTGGWPAGLWILLGGVVPLVRRRRPRR